MRNLSRRAVLAGLAAAGAMPARAAAPSRIACLEWTSAELVVSLGLEPIAVSDTKGYRDWVAAPPLPAGTIDLGSRGEPNLELLAELKPDLIVGAYGYGLDAATFARFAPVWNVPFYDGTGTPYAQAESEALRLARHLGRTDIGERFAIAAAATIAAAKEKLAARAAEPLAVVSMFDDRHVRIYGRGGLFQDVLDRMGVANAWTGETNSWGFSTTGIEQLVAVGEARLISLDPIPPHVAIRIARSSLWANLPCVRAGKVTTIPPVWPFGGLAAAARFAGLLAEAV
ncbi:ABC transporter substrate-binding protein [Mesorhizobium sp. L-8-3]|uniref:ABC transporter substrate-binding protein n=1 Tax=Mesorhizobium sp. L-8-3 TaxID=2744522 RepID=UPI001937BFDC|nr:ABC transporter substrate-binding protein [Mesorhizobium sp. L-8-3]BCH21111.1 ABC transporter substrate-binding protein [Mesorhizobium sp. L-8-3]